MAAFWSRLARSIPLLRRAATIRAARTHLVDGSLDGARSLLESACAEYPEWAEPWYLLGRCAGQEGDRIQEESAYLEAVARDPAHRRAQDALLKLRSWRHRPIMDAWQLYFAGRAAEALQAFGRGRERMGGTEAGALEAEIQSGTGWSLFGLGRFGEAKEAFVAATRANPGLVHAQKGLGLALYRLGEYDAAEAALRVALGLQKDLFDAQAFLGWCSYARGDFRAALDRFRRAVAMNPLDPDAAWGVAWALARQNRAADAAPAFDEAIGKGASHPSVHDAILLFAGDSSLHALLARAGRALLREGSGLSALDAWSRLLAEEPGPVAAAGCAQALLATGRPEGVAEVLSCLDDAGLDTAVAEDVVVTPGLGAVERSTTPRVLLGRAALSRGDHAAAIAIFQTAASRSPDVRTARLHLAEARAAAGDLVGAEAGFREIADDPGCGAAARKGIQDIARRRRAGLLTALERLVTGDHQGALDAVLAAPARDSDDAWRAKVVESLALARMGREAEGRCALGDARALLEDAIARNAAPSWVTSASDLIEEARDGRTTGSPA